MVSPGRLQHIFYEHEIPSEIGRSLENLYQSPFCVTKYFEIFRDARNLNVLVISGGESDPLHILAYVISGKEITVLNELVPIEQEYLQYFSDTVFNRYPAITKVNFNCIKSKIEDLPYHWKLWKRSHDIAIGLPRSFDAYHSSLSKHTRKNIKYYLNRLQKYDDFAFHISATHEIDPSVISSIIEMNRLRMKSKNIRSGYTSRFEKQIMEFCRHYGVISSISFQGRIAAGTICYEVGDQTYMEIISHHPDFDKDRVGQVCLYLTIRQMIEKGKVSFHMLWGENEYKYRFLGVKHELSFLTVYRSAFAKRADIRKLLRHAYTQAVKQVVYVTHKYLIKRRQQGN